MPTNVQFLYRHRNVRYYVRTFASGKEKWTSLKTNLLPLWTWTTIFTRMGDSAFAEFPCFSPDLSYDSCKALGKPEHFRFNLSHGLGRREPLRRFLSWPL
jgi:hypothetical protein